MEGFPGTISLKFHVDVNGWPRYQTVYKYCGKFQLPLKVRPYGSTETNVLLVGCTSVTDRRQMADRWARAYSEWAREFTFAKMCELHTNW